MTPQGAVIVPFFEIDLNDLAGVELLHGVGNEHRHADVDAVAAEDTGEALRHDEGDLRLLEGDGGLLAGRSRSRSCVRLRECSRARG